VDEDRHGTIPDRCAHQAGTVPLLKDVSYLFYSIGYLVVNLVILAQNPLEYYTITKLGLEVD